MVLLPVKKILEGEKAFGMNRLVFYSFNKISLLACLDGTTSVGRYGNREQS